MEDAELARVTVTTFPERPFFPPVDMADEDGLLLIGGRLSTPWLLEAFRRGIFPWPLADAARTLAWWAPDPRAVFELDEFHVPRRLERTIRSERFDVTCDRDFAGVIQGCSEPRRDEPGTWITPALRRAYMKLADEGIGHSVEAWHEGRLAGGVYGVALGGLFSAESMFFRERDASKVALVALARHLNARGFTLFDIQLTTPHTERFGATEIPRRSYNARVTEALALPVTFGTRLEGQ